MSISRPINLALMTSLFFTIHAFAQEKEKRIKRSDLPAAVKKTIRHESHGATIRGFSEEKEKGQTFYEAQLMVDGHSKDVLMDANGAIAEIQEEVSGQALPALAREGLQAKAGKSKLLKVESITKRGKVVAYEAVVLTGGKKSELQVGPDGRTLDHEE